MTITLARTLETENPYLRATGQIATTQAQVNAAVRAMPTMGELTASAGQIGGAGVQAMLPGQQEARGIEEERYRFEAAQLSTAMETATDDELPAIRDRLYALEDERKAFLDAGTKAQLNAGKIEQPMVLAERYPVPGLQFDRPMSNAEAKLLADGKKAEIIRDAIIASGPTGFMSSAQKFGNGLIAMATDPLEVATMFIPVVGQAGKAWAVSRFGRVGGRVLVGSAEGGLGSALTEPVYAGLSRAMQLDYDMNDSLMNVGLGFVLGGGIGAVGGALTRRAKQPATAALDGGAVPIAETRASIADAAAVAPVAKLSDDAAAVYAARTETMRLAEEQRPAAETALRQMVTDQAVNVAPVMPKWTALDEIKRLNVELKTTAKFPLTRSFMGKLDPQGPVAKELAHQGITNRTMPGLFKKGGVGNIDNIPASEMEGAFPGISGRVGVSNGYLSEDGLVRAIVDELAGRDIGVRNKASVGAEIAAARKDADTLADVHAKAKAAGLDLKTEAEVRFAADLMARGVAPERLADEMKPEVALAVHAKTDYIGDEASSAEVSAYVPQPVQEEIAYLESMVAQLSDNDAFEAAAMEAIIQRQAKAKAMIDAVNAAATCMARQ